MAGFLRLWLSAQLVITAALVTTPLWLDRLVPATSLSGPPGPPGDAMHAFPNATALDRFLAAASVPLLAINATAADAAADVAPASPALPEPAAEAITNVQTAGVDEGGIVKRRGDIFVVLRRGRLFTVSMANDQLTRVDQIDIFPTGDGAPASSDETWYDEMLVSGDNVVVIGFSYARSGTEIIRFKLGDDGALTYRDTHHLRSADYYSDRNYASRLIGDRLIIYTPLPRLAANARDALPAIAKWRGSAASQHFVPYADHGDVYMADPYWRADFDYDVVFHTVSTCDIAIADLECSAQIVLGSWSRSFYVASDAVYIWTGTVEHDGNLSMLYRMPLDGGAPQAVQVAGSPIDQFSFRQDDDVLNVLTSEYGGGDAMWNAEWNEGENLALLRLPLSAFGSGSGKAATGNYRSIPSHEAYGIQNRFVGSHLIYGWAESENPGSGPAPAYAVPLAGGAAIPINVGHAISRIDQMGLDPILIGQNRSGALTFSTLQLSANPSISNQYRVPGAGEGENRSHGFLYRADDATADGASGMLGLPITRQRNGSDGRFLGSSGSILFLRRTDRVLTKAGELAGQSGNDDDNCLASCTDWYGNARPIFIGSRIFALLGYELVEGAMADGRIRELRRVDFTPRRREMR